MNAALVFQVLAGLALIAAGLLQVAVIRSPDVPNDVRPKLSGRRVMCLAMLIAGAYILSMSAQGATTDRVMTLCLGLFGLSQGVFSFVKLFPEEFRHGRH